MHQFYQIQVGVFIRLMLQQHIILLGKLNKDSFST